MRFCAFVQLYIGAGATLRTFDKCHNQPTSKRTIAIVPKVRMIRATTNSVLLTNMVGLFLKHNKWAEERKGGVSGVSHTRSLRGC